MNTSLNCGRCKCKTCVECAGTPVNKRPPLPSASWQRDEVWHRQRTANDTLRSPTSPTGCCPVAVELYRSRITDARCCTNRRDHLEPLRPVGAAGWEEVPSHPIPSHPIPARPIASHPIPFHPIPYHTIPYHTIPYHTIPYHTILEVIQDHSVLCPGKAWPSMAQHGPAWHGTPLRPAYPRYAPATPCFSSLCRYNVYGFLPGFLTIIYQLSIQCEMTTAVIYIHSVFLLTL